MKHKHITVVIMHEKAGVQIVGEIPATHQEAFQEALKDGLTLTFPIFNARFIVTHQNGNKHIS